MSNEGRDFTRWLKKRGWDVWQDQGFWHAEHPDTTLHLKFGANVPGGHVNGLKRDADRATGGPEAPLKRNVANVRERREKATAKKTETARSLNSERAVLRSEKSASVDEFEAKARKITSEREAKIGAFKLTTHALAQMLRQSVTAVEVADALTRPVTINVSGPTPTYVGRSCYVVADPDRRLIVTVGLNSRSNSERAVTVRQSSVPAVPDRSMDRLMRTPAKAS